MIRIVGSCDQRIFGITPAERLRRQQRQLCDQLQQSPGLIIVASASAVLSDSAVSWLLENPGRLLLTPAGRPAAMATNEAELEGAVSAIESNGSEAGGIAPAEIGDVFVRKLRRRDTLLVRRLNEVSVRHLERELFDTVYKGITDVVTKYVWPVPAYWVTRICSRLHVHPNLITLIGIAAMIMATILWARGELVAGMLFAWLMTFLDTVDGKLARVTATSSKLGDRLDHITDIIHPPIWWAALAYGLAGQADAVQRPLVWGSCLIILVGYFVGRTIETAFKTRFRYNCYLWRPFDSAFRLVVSRRNIILLIMTAGLILGVPIAAFVAAAAWTLISGVIQVVRLAQAYRAGQDGSLPSWLM